MSILRVAIAGSVDDGKSTLLGRLLHDTGSLRLDQVEKITKAGASKGMDLDLASVADGLKAEQEQGITIDVAYRYLDLDGRRLILADTPGHEQYTRNMFTGASTAWASLLLVDAKRGLRDQTRRHASIAKLQGHQTLVFLINKMDAVQYSESKYNSLAAQCQQLANQLNVSRAIILPISALTGDNVVHPSEHMTWWTGTTVLDVLKNLERPSRARTATTLSIQSVLTQQVEGATRRLLAVRFDGPPLHQSQELSTSSGRIVTLKSIYSGGQEVTVIDADQDALIELNEEVDIARGDWLFTQAETLSKAAHPVACWFAEKTGRIGQKVLVRHGHQWLKAVISEASDSVDLGSLCYHTDRPPLQANSIGRIGMKFAKALPFGEFQHDRVSGSMILVDPESRQTLAAGVLAPIPGVESDKETRTT